MLAQNAAFSRRSSARTRRSDDVHSPLVACIVILSVLPPSLIARNMRRRTRGKRSRPPRPHLVQSCFAIDFDKLVYQRHVRGCRGKHRRETKMIDFKALETFIWVANLRSFRRAADRLNTTQPAVSMRIAQLEQVLGIRLLERDSGWWRRRRRARSFSVHAERLIRMRAEMIESIGDPRRGARHGPPRRLREHRPYLAAGADRAGQRRLSQSRARDRGRHFAQSARSAGGQGPQSRLPGRAGQQSECAQPAALHLPGRLRGVEQDQVCHGRRSISTTS